MILLLVLATVSSIIILIMNYRSKISFWISGILFGWYLSMTGLLLIISKFGGVYYQVNQILFINDQIRQFLLFYMISFEMISRMIVYGRSLFIFCLFGFSVSIYKKYKLKSMLLLFYINTVLSLLNIIIYEPVIFNKLLGVLKRNQLFYISLCVRIWITLFILITVFVLIMKYLHMTIPWIRKKIHFICFGILSISAFYLYLFFGKVKDVQTFYYVYSDFSYYNPSLSIYEWFFWIALSAITLLIMTISIWKYTRVELQMGRFDVILERKMHTANMGVNVLSHAIKNQILMIKLLSKQAKESCLNSNTIDLQVINSLQGIDEISEQILNRLELLYKSLKFKKIGLKPMEINRVMKELEQKITVPDNISISFEESEDNNIILIDLFYFYEAVQNIVTNAAEAIKGNKGEVNLRSYTEENWFVIAITDNGPGIAPEDLNKIFDPFYSDKNSSRNWGVGLSFVKKTVTAHYGRIAVKSELGKGAEFYIFMPIYKGI